MTHISELVRPAIRKLQPYSSARDEFSGARDSMVFIDANENPYGAGLNRYPDPQQRQLKALIGAWRGVDPAQILLGNGSDEVLDMLFRVFCEPATDQIITLPPSYGMYKVLAGINAVTNMEIPLDSGFQPAVEEILAVASKTTKLLFLCSPNNPTGNSMDPRRVEQLLQGFPGLVVIDEAYIDFSSGKSMLPFLDRYPNLIVTQTFSKAMGLAGIRLGICFASPEVISYLKRVKPPYNVNELTQREAKKRLENSEQMKEQIAAILQERAVLSRGLQQLACVREVMPSDANFILARVDDAGLRYRQLLDKGVVVRNRSRQHGCENTLRFTVGTPAENQYLLTSLRELSKISSDG
jgi:histidinol-phosphate aminotransferase